MTKQIGIIGLGKMGKGIARNLHEDGWDVVVYNRTSSVTDELRDEGMAPAYSYENLVMQLDLPRKIWIMVPAGDPTDEVLSELIPLLESEDIIIDAGNAYFKNTKERAGRANEKGIKYIDVGVSGGPIGARNGACLMIGADKNDFYDLEKLYQDVSDGNSYMHFEGIGAGHFVKMVHNGIEYGMMQSIAEGFDVLKNSDFDISLKDAAEIYSKKSVIESRLVSWLYDGFMKMGEDLETASGTASHSGEGEWTVNTGEEMGIAVDVIKDSFNARVKSHDNPSFQGKIISMLRHMFGGHDI